MREVLKKIKLNNNISIPFLIAIFSFIILNYFVISSIAKQENLSCESFRVHIVANSNSTQDQNMKYLVKDEVTKYLDDSIKQSNINVLASKKDTKDFITENIENILDVAQKKVLSCGYNYDVHAKIGKINYTTKLSNYYSMPAGSYDALEISLGSGEGKNWWGLIYPGSLSIPDNYFELVKNANSDNPYDNNVDVEFDFKLLEIINNWLT